NSGAALSVGNTLELLAPLTNSGTLTVAAGGPGAISISNNLGTTSGGIVNLAGSAINLNNANGISGGNNHEFLVNQGTINSSGGGSILSVPLFTNAGAIFVTANALNLDSGLHLLSSGSVNLQFNGTSGYGKISINGAAALTGAFNVTLGNSYNPQNGDSFQPVTYSSFSGNFTSTNLPALVPWQMAYTPSAVTLSVTTRTISWTNTLGGNWSNPNNWNPNIVPGGSAYGNDDDVQIVTPGTYTVVFDEGAVSSPYYVHSLSIGAGSSGGFQTMVVSNKWLDAGTMVVNWGGKINSTASYWFNNWVTPLTIADRAVFNSTNDLFDQNVTVNLGGSFNVANSTNGNGALTLNGTMTIPTGTYILNANGEVTNSGYIAISSGATLSVNNNVVLTGSGQIYNASGGTISLSGGHGITSDNGAEILLNQGMINSSGGYISSVPNFSNSGTINALTGTLNLDSGLHLQSTGKLNTQLNSASDYGKFAFSGNAALAGTFGVTLNYSPAAGDSFTPLTYGSSSGSLTFNLPALGAGQTWQTSQGATALTLQINEAVTWTNTAGGNWSSAANWVPNKVPGQFDDVAITVPGTYTVTADISPNIKSLTLGTGGGVNGTNTLSVVNKTFYVNPLTIGGGGILTNNSSTFHAVINVQNGGQLNTANGIYYANPLTVGSGGTLNSSGSDVFHQSLLVNSGGLFISTSGASIENDGFLTVANGGTVTIPVNVLTLYGPMTNSGSVSMASNGGIYIYNNGTSESGILINQPSGVVNLNGGNGLQVGPFINRGSVISTGNGAVILTTPFDTSAGTVSNVMSGATLHLSYFTNFLAGVFYATNDATIQFSGGAVKVPLKPGNPLVLAGNGFFQFQYGWLDFPTNIIPNLDLRGGFLQLETTFQGGAITNLGLDGITLTNFNQLPVTNGIFSATNSTVYGNFTVQSSGQLFAYSAQFHSGITIASGGQFTTPGAVIEPDGWLGMNGTLTLVGAGVLSLYGPMTNSGIVNVPGNSGIYIYNNQSPSYLGGLINLSAGVINITGNNGVQGGGFGDEYFLNQGTVNSTVGGQVTGIVGFTNSGAINSFSGTMTLRSITLLSSGSLNVRLNSKTDYGKFFINGTAALNGGFGATLNGSYVPGVGDSFTPLTYSAYTGSFTATNLPPLVAWQTTYGASALTLLVTQIQLIPEFTTSGSSGGNLIFNGTNGTPGNPFWILSSTNVSTPLPQWTSVYTNNFGSNGQFSYTNTPHAGEPQRFFILRLP
ncbi:MAG TPA: hypothetical protein VMH87_02515, partial [Pseudomonadales bacterium]|nr:hypothetical protein [Pseudomonadales bacterium]